MNLPANRGSWRAYAACFRDHRLSLLLLTLAGLAQSFAWVPGAAILRRIFEEILPEGHGLPAGAMAAFGVAVAQLMALQVGGLFVAWWIRTAALRLSQDVVAGLRASAIEHFYTLPRAFHTQADVEKLHLTMVHETSIIDAMNIAVTTQMLPGVCGVLVLFRILMRIEPVYAVILAVVAPVLFVVNRATERDVWLRQQRVRQAWEAFSRGVRFMIQAFELTRAHAAEEFETARQKSNIRELRGVSLELNRFDAAQQILQGFLLLTCTLAALLAGGWSVAAGHATRGQVMVFYVTAAMFAVQVRSIVDSVPPLRRGLESFGELEALLRVGEREPYQGRLAVSAIESVQLRDVWFGYREATPVLSGASFAIRRGEHVALTGANGAGKSTIGHLITGLYRPSRGGLFVNGVPYEEADIRALRGRMAILPQNPFLFPGTIRENLTYGPAAYGAAELRQALEWSGASAFVEGLPGGLDAQIGESGILLSGGQRQKLVLARALLRQPDFLIFDEPTNHLDEEAIAMLLGNLARLPFHPAVLMISHDPAAIRHASRAWRLEDGALREEAIGSR